MGPVQTVEMTEVRPPVNLKDINLDEEDGPEPADPSATSAS
jgi:hypothetical protein